MHSQNEGPGVTYLAGGLIAIVVLMMIVKAINQFLIGLSVALDNFGKMMGSLVFTLWNTFEVVALVAMILGAAVGGVYFVYRYCLAVRELTGNRQWLTSRLQEVAYGMETRSEATEQKFHDRVDDAFRRIGHLDARLTEALKKPEVAVLTVAIPSAAISIPGSDSTQREEIVSSNPF